MEVRIPDGDLDMMCLVLFQMLEEEVERLTIQLESSSKPKAFDFARRGALLRKVRVQYVLVGKI